VTWTLFLSKDRFKIN